MCPACDGSGVQANDAPEMIDRRLAGDPCYYCDGACSVSKERYEEDLMLTKMMSATECEFCNGTGMGGSDGDCGMCGGTGYFDEDELV